MKTYNDKPYIVEVDGVQVFSADFVFEQMQAQGRRIDRARRIARVAQLMSAVGIGILVFILLGG